ncbi:hypothetical protein N566_06240 [Streptomycetaceae bacterium MP113-05]|nr:hypothetical protein N566_06240 [Streptomycetaceae bacterium MP113-05]
MRGRIPDITAVITVITLRIHALEEDRTRSVWDAVLGGLRTGCGQDDQAIKEIAGQRA